MFYIGTLSVNQSNSSTKCFIYSKGGWGDYLSHAYAMLDNKQVPYAL